MRRLTILLAALGALMLVPASSAFAEIYYSGNVKVNVTGTGSGEVVNRPDDGFFHPSNPPIACSYNGSSASGSCEGEVAAVGEPEEEEIEEGLLFYATALEAIPASGSELIRWERTSEGGHGGACPQTANHYRCSLASNTEEDKEFEVLVAFCLEGEIFQEGKCVTPNLALNIEEGAGTVVSSPAGLQCNNLDPTTCKAKVAEGKVTLTASPFQGYLVKSWKGCDAGGVNGRQCTVTAGTSLKSVGVKFYQVFKLKAEKVGLGIMGTSPGGINCGYACNSSFALYKEGGLTIKAKPAKHFHFVEFKGGTGSAASCNGVTAETCTIASFGSDSAIKEVYAEDAKKTLKLSKYEDGGQGFIKTKPTNINCGLTCTAAEAEFFASESPEVSVTLGKGTSKVTWMSGAGTCTGNALTCTVPMSESHTLSAKFE